MASVNQMKTIAVWKGYYKDYGYLVPIDEIESYVIPTIDPKRYFKINKERLADYYDIDIEKIHIDNVDWEREQVNFDEAFNDIAVKLDDFDEEYATIMGYKMPIQTDEIFKAWTYFDSGMNRVRVWENDFELTSEYNITENSVSLDEWDGKNHCTGDMAYSEDVHKIIGTDEYLIVRHSRWSGEQSVVIETDLSLNGVLSYIENLDDGNERNLEEYKQQLLEL